MNRKSIIRQTADYVRKTLTGDSSGHDWWHVSRVWQNAIRIGKDESADMYVIELAALLHDIGDWKLHDGDESIGPKMVEEWLRKFPISKSTIVHICQITRDISFKGNGVNSEMSTMEGKVVQDADRLDAIGAIGIARTFAYGGYIGNEIHNPSAKPVIHRTFKEYKSKKGPTINHFYEKLLLLKDLMNTKTAKKIARKRHQFMEQYLETFFQELEGK